MKRLNIQMILLRKVFVILTPFFLAVAFAATITKEATLAGFPQATKVVLTFGDQNQLLLNKMSEWEQKLASEGLQVRFLLGAGELRRAVLGMSTDGPGDVEVFIHILDRNLNPLSLNQAFQLFISHGVDVKGDLHALFGEKKKVDAYLKDQKGLAEGRAYRGDYGFFEGMGDTSLNQLVYSPTDSLLLGSPQNLETLSRGHIQFLELSKVQTLKEEEKITGTEVLTQYPETILKQSLRSLRLYFDLLLSSNPNQLKMDDSFKEAIRGFELFFANAKQEDLKEFVLDEAYLAHFIKLFKNRSLSDRQTILQGLEEHFPKTLKLFDALGLDYRLLANKIPPRRTVQQVEFLAIYNNAAFYYLKPFLSPTALSVLNPFTQARAKTKLFALAAEGKLKNVKFKHIPESLLKLYSHKLSLEVAHFESLEKATQARVIKDYINALKAFHGLASERFSQVTFGSKLYELFSFVDLTHLAQGDQRSLLDFLEEELALASEKSLESNRVQSLEYNRGSIQSIEQRMHEALGDSQKPVLIVDLDNTLFVSASRDEYFLKSFDKLSGTDYFKDVHYSQFSKMGWKEFVFAHLAKQGVPLVEIQGLYESLVEHVADQRWSEDAFAAEQVNSEFSEQLKRWKSQGAEIVFLSARSNFDRKATLAQLKREGFADHQVILSNRDSSVRDYKLREAKVLLESDPTRRIVAFFDDNPTVLNFIKASAPEMNPVRIYLRHHEETKTTSSFLATEDAAHLTIFGSRDYSQCRLFLGKLGKLIKAKIPKKKVAKKVAKKPK